MASGNQEKPNIIGNTLLIGMFVFATCLLQSCIQITPTRGSGMMPMSTTSTNSSASSQEVGKRVALVIGNNRYPSPLDLNNPVNDATDIYGKLVKLGFDAELKTDLNKPEMEAAIGRFEQKASKANVALLYFSGHGFQVNGENILVPINYTINDGLDEGVSANLIQRKMQNATNGTKLLILDACRNNPFSTEPTQPDTDPIQQKSVMSKKARKLELGKQRGDMREGLADMPRVSEFIIMFSTAAGTKASDGVGRNSPYTTALLEHIEKPMPIETLFKRVTATVEQNSSETPPQSPANYTTGLKSDFCFVAGCGMVISEPSKVCRLNIGDGIYEGECENGKANGQGVQRYADGEYYSGSFKDNLRDGRGTQYFVDATEISGTWKAGLLVIGD